MPLLEESYPAFRGELHSLTRETDLEILAADLYAFGARQEREGRNEVAAQIYASLLHHIPSSEESLNALKRRAQGRLEALQGRGPLSGRFEILARSFAQQAADPAMLTGMFLGGAVFQTARLATLSRLAASPTANLLTRGLGARSLSWIAGFALEVPAFTLSTRGLHQALGQSQDWNAGAISRDLLSNGLTLFLLKGSGALGNSATRRLSPAGANDAFTRFSAAAIPQAAAFTGIVASRLLETRLGWRPESDASNIFADSLATLLQFHVGGRILHGVTGGTYERSLELYRDRLQNSPGPGPKRPSPSIFGRIFPEMIPAVPQGEVSDYMTRPLLMSSNEPKDPNRFLETTRATSLLEEPAAKPPIPVNENPPLFTALRDRFSQNEHEIYTLLEEQPGAAMWVDQSLRVALELSEHLNLVNQHLLNPNDRSTLLQITEELHWIRNMLEEIREQDDLPTIESKEVRDFLGALYRIPNKTVNYLNTGELADLKGSLLNASDARGLMLNSIHRFQISNRDAWGPLSAEEIKRPPRLTVDPLDPKREVYVPAYDYRDEELTPFLEIIGTGRKVVLLGEVPFERIDLSRRHQLEIIPNDNGQRPEIAKRAIENGALERVKIIWPEWKIRTRDAHYLEGYDIASAERLRGDHGISLIQDQVFDRLRPGGIAFLVSRDSSTLQRMVQIATRNHWADVIAGSYGGHLPVEVSRADQESGHFVFLRKLPQF
ncbi:MAG: hypothetical protein K8R69_06285 [Deltaproteobacteria bacterium]|nr:hypothetical protein [Deltaproteobacteria bacterium]